MAVKKRKTPELNTNTFNPDDLDKINIILKEISLDSCDLMYLKDSISFDDYWKRVESLYAYKLKEIKKAGE